MFDGMQRRGGRRAAAATTQGAVFLCHSLVLCHVFRALGCFLGSFPIIPLPYCEYLVGLQLKVLFVCPSRCCSLLLLLDQQFYFTTLVQFFCLSSIDMMTRVDMELSVLFGVALCQVAVIWVCDCL
jgi:hypothetical protein